MGRPWAFLTLRFHPSSGYLHQCEFQLLRLVISGIVYAFNTKVPPRIAKAAEEKKVPIKEHNVIYRLIDDLKAELTARLIPLDEEEVIGKSSHDHSSAMRFFFRRTAESIAAL